ncbi:MAG: hypothetical protein IPG69_18855 [Flavobacteriales bacterium]|nr:hypothetical protein [Flavobacteriales bacterium]
MRYATFIVAAFLFGSLGAQTTKSSTGTAVLDIGNSRDITHERNTEAREKLMQGATLDAVERVVAIDISVTTALHITEHRSADAGTFRDQYMNEVLQRYHVKWSRSGDYTFRRDPSDARVWVCTVTGQVEQLPSADTPVLNMDAIPMAPYILAKRGAAVYLSPGTGSAIATGQRYEVVRRSHASYRVPGEKVKGRIVVLAAEPGSQPLARIVKGRYAVHERYTLRPATFPLLRGGLRVAYFERDAWQRMEGARASRPITGFSFDYFEQSLLDGLGVTLGLDLFTDQATDSTRFQSLAVRLGGIARLPLLPEVLSLRPTASIGYAQPHQVYKLDGQILLQGQLDLCLHLGLMDLSAGVRYTHLLTDPGLNGTYAIGSLGVDLYRLIPSARERTQPALRSLIKSLGGR